MCISSPTSLIFFFFFNDTATTEIYTFPYTTLFRSVLHHLRTDSEWHDVFAALHRALRDRKSTRLNSSHANISYAVFCLKKKNRPCQSLHLGQKKPAPTNRVRRCKASACRCNKCRTHPSHWPCSSCLRFFFFNDTATTEIYTLSLHDALPISSRSPSPVPTPRSKNCTNGSAKAEDRKSTRLNSSHANISYAVFCLKKKKK